MKKILILSCSTGQGHNSCAQAIKEYFEQRRISCEIRDAFEFISKRFAGFMSWGHSYVYKRLPGLFRWGYRYSEEHPDVFKHNSGVYRMLVTGAERMYRYIADGQYDTVICTHVLAAVILTHTVKNHALAVDTAFVATDYTCYPGMKAFDLQRYFVADESLIGTYVECGIPRQRIIAAGIPVRQSFFAKTDIAEAKARLAIDKRNSHLLMMCGSMGCGPMEAMLRHIAKKLPARVEVSVICGRNKQLYNRLKRRYSKNSRIHIVGYTDDVSLYMDSADLYITKPGGISVTEAAAKQLPMMFVDAVAGCERYNMSYFISMGAAITAGSAKGLAEKSIQLISSERELSRMRTALREYRQPNGAEPIYHELKDACKTELNKGGARLCGK